MPPNPNPDTHNQQPPKFEIQQLAVSYSGKLALKPFDLTILRHEIFAIIGPANSGKSTFLRTLNRMLDLTPQAKATGRVLLDGEDLLCMRDVEKLRRRIGIVFALPLPLPLSIFENVAYGPRRLHTVPKSELPEVVERSLTEAFLWEEVKDRLDEPALNLSGGQQQRLCLARTLAVRPEVLMLDEPCSGLDPISTGQVESALQELKKDYTIILVTNLVAQAGRCSDRTAFFLMGELVEVGETDKVFTEPRDQRTEDYLTGRFG